MGMPLTLVSNHKGLEIRNHAAFTYRCDGKPRFPTKEDGSDTCTNLIQKGEMYVARVEWRPVKSRAIPLMKVDAGKFCAHCALRLFVDIRAGEAAHA